VTDRRQDGEGDNLWSRLRRRKVVQWGVAYAAGAWGLLQGLAYVSELLEWPAQLQKLTGLALLIGLPIALVLAWYHGDRGETHVTRTELAMLTLLFLLGGGLFWRYQHTTESATPTAVNTTEVTAATTAADAGPSIAVLPFENRSAKQDDAYFVDGIHDDILTQLSKISALKVISRTSVEQFRDTKLPMKDIAAQLGVKSLLEGGVQRAGDRVRINVQLIDAGTDVHLWAETYDRELTAENIFAIQTELAAAIAGALKAALTPAEKARVNAVPTWNLEAWEAYQLGNLRLSKRTNAALEDSEKYFRQAIALDPSFALGWTGLANALSLQVYYGSRPQDPGLHDAEQAVTRALELDPNLAEAWAVAGSIADSQLRLDRAEQMLQRAIELKPNYASAHHWLSMTLTNLGRHEDALAAAERAVMLDPLSAIINNWLGAARANVGRFDDALVAFKRAIEIDPAMAIVYTNVGDIHAYGLGRTAIAIPWYEAAAERDPGDPTHAAYMAFANHELGNDAVAGRWIARTLGMGEGNAWSNFVLALHYLARGDEKAARQHAARAAALDPDYLFLMRDFDRRQGDYSAARARYAASFPHLLTPELPTLNDREARAAIDLALVLQHTGESEQAKLLLDRSEKYVRTIPRMGTYGYGVSDVAIHALRGDTPRALARLREAERAGWRGGWHGWRYYRDFDPNLASIRNEPKFKAVFADIERDMARQRAELAKRPKDAPLDLGESRK
jgi:TolB-like protein/Tfp pilus assembly protein PilF